jgi:peptide-methionine (S)-S-oxide reductase
MAMKLGQGILAAALAAAGMLMGGVAVAEDKTAKTEVATLGGGCFWCIEAVFERTDGVVSAVSGYAGGKTANPTYEEVCTGRTGHAEVVQVTFDPARISYEAVLGIFFKAHDPTTLNRQGADVGTQYRSVIFTHGDEQRKTAERVMAGLKRSRTYADPIVTEVKPLEAFYPAEGYHQDYYENNSAAGYCTYVIAPKLKKLELQVAPLSTKR